jgi:hypothetical protein
VSGAPRVDERDAVARAQQRERAPAAEGARAHDDDVLRPPAPHHRARGERRRHRDGDELAARDLVGHGGLERAQYWNVIETPTVRGWFVR